MVMLKLEDICKLALRRPRSLRPVVFFLSLDPLNGFFHDYDYRFRLLIQDRNLLSTSFVLNSKDLIFFSRMIIERSKRA